MRAGASDDVANLVEHDIAGGHAMTPSQIDLVVSSWSKLRSTQGLASFKQEAIDAFGHSVHDPESRAEWLAEAVERLYGHLAEPARLADEASELIAQRGRVTTEEITHDQDALIAALVAIQGPLSTEMVEAWRAGCALFWEIVAAKALDPFAR
jgi:hypothetical protein